MSMTIIGDLYSIAERSKVQGYVASVWGVSSVVGPTLGGVFSDYLSWRWIFFVNVPIAVAAAYMLIRRFREDVTRTHHRIDYAGAVTLAIGGSLLILGLLEGGVEWAWDSTASIAVLTAGDRAPPRVRRDRAPGGRADPADVGLPSPGPGRSQCARASSSACC